MELRERERERGNEKSPRRCAMLVARSRPCICRSPVDKEADDGTATRPSIVETKFIRMIERDGSMISNGRPATLANSECVVIVSLPRQSVTGNTVAILSSISLSFARHNKSPLFNTIVRYS